MNAFGDYAGIKKDDLNAGGTISPGFIFYDPLDNLYYGFKGEVKDLAEFERTIVPAVLNSPVVARILAEQPLYLSADNWGYQQLRAIRTARKVVRAKRSSNASPWSITYIACGRKST